MRQVVKLGAIQKGLGRFLLVYLGQRPTSNIEHQTLKYELRAFS